jgi:pimeloyl-ACP methyl ester carboxylesterase
MPGSSLTAHALEVPGACLYCERRGSGPLLLLLLIRSPMDSTGFAGLADALAGRYTVVTCDPRGIGNSSREDSDQDVTPEQQADDVHRLLSVLGGPADVFGSSGGAVVGLALVTAHPGQVRTLVAHEPPVIDVLPDREQVRAHVRDIYDTYQAEWADKAMGKFMAHAGLAGPAGHDENAPRWQPSPEQNAWMRAATDVFLAHLIRPTTGYRPDIAALRAAPAWPRRGWLWRGPLPCVRRRSAGRTARAEQDCQGLARPRRWPSARELRHWRLPAVRRRSGNSAAALLWPGVRAARSQPTLPE